MKVLEQSILMILKLFIQYSNDMDDIYQSIETYNPKKKRKILIVFDDMIPNIISNKKSKSN